MSRNEDAIDALTSALMKPNFASEKGLNDALVEAYGGFPDTVTNPSFAACQHELMRYV